MPAAARRRLAEPEVAPAPKEAPAPSPVQVAEEACAPAPSPAQALLARLERDLLTPDQEDAIQGKWPLYVSLPLWGGVSALMWAAIIGCAWLLLRRH